MINKVWEIVITLCSILLIGASIGLFIIAVYPFDVMEVKSPLKIISPIVEQGDCVFVEMEYTQKISGPSVVTVQVVTEDDINIASQILGLNLEEGHHIVQVGFMLPRNINIISDKKTILAKLKLTSRFEVGGFKNVDINYCTEPFKIILRK